MVKYFCDVCEKEVMAVSLRKKEVYKNYKSAPVEVQICPDCYTEFAIEEKVAHKKAIDKRGGK